MQHYTLLNKAFDYLIRFQNMGNDTAFNVMVTDTLDPNFDITTFRLLHNSHSCSVEILPGNILRFRFNNILLPDSNINEPASHGFIHYTINHFPATAANTIVYNTAHIYFDFNFPVATNTTFNTLVTIIPTSISSGSGFNNEINIIPNPFNESTLLSFNNDHHDLISISLLDISGRAIKTYTTINSEFRLNTSAIEKGIYILRLINSATSEMQVTKLLRN